MPGAVYVKEIMSRRCGATFVVERRKGPLSNVKGWTEFHIFSRGRMAWTRAVQARSRATHCHPLCWFEWWINTSGSTYCWILIYRWSSVSGSTPAAAFTHGLISSAAGSPPVHVFTCSWSMQSVTVQLVRAQPVPRLQLDACFQLA